MPDNDRDMLSDLLEAVKTAAAMECVTPTFSMTVLEQHKFAHFHPGAHMVIGDFEIRCLKPEKYGLPSACDEFNARMEAAMKVLMIPEKYNL